MENTLTRINLDDLVSAFGWGSRPVLRACLRFFFRGAAAKFSEQMLVFDRQVGSDGLAQAAHHSLQSFVKELRVFGQANLPATGPVLFLSNHPGMTDTLCLFAALGRPDLLIIALRRPFLQALPNVSKHLLFLGDDPTERMSAVRMASSHLRKGGAVLTFPAGEIEPDPDVYAGADASLDKWSDSAGVFLRFAPETEIVPLLVRNVLWDKAVRHPLTHLRADRVEREQLGASLQLLAQTLFKAVPVRVKLEAAAPINLDETGTFEPSAIHSIVLERMRALLNAPLAEAGRLVV